MTWTSKPKTPSLLERSRILTIDGFQILAGSGEDNVLIGQERDSFWDGVLKTASTSSNKSKVSSELERTRILTIDGKQILAGASEDSVLIGQFEDSLWGNSSKELSYIDKIRILTIDGFQILVGAHENATLISEPVVSFWESNLKSAGSWTNKAKST